MGWLDWFFIIFLVLLFTGTRGAFLGFLGGIVIFLFLLFLLTGKKQKVIISLIIGAIIFLFLSAFVFDIKILKKNKYWDFERIASISFSEASGVQRLILWKIALKSSMAHPILGWGLENIDYAFDRYYDAELLKFGVNQTWADRAHNLSMIFFRHETTSAPAPIMNKPK
ncbi:O-antigen ligase family protein [Patescibacteria group bacterium]